MAQGFRLGVLGGFRDVGEETSHRSSRPSRSQSRNAASCRSWGFQQHRFLGDIGFRGWDSLCLQFRGLYLLFKGWLLLKSVGKKGPR